MNQATQTLRDAAVGVDDDFRPPAPRIRSAPAVPACTGFHISVHENPAAVERDWRAFEQVADCTAFQSFDWLSAWLRHVGVLHGVRPAIVVVRDDAGTMLMLLPLMVLPGGFARRLTFLGADLCDYNAPLIAKDLSVRLKQDGFKSLWRDVLLALGVDARLRFDLIELSKMPEHVGEQRNPFLELAVVQNANRAYCTRLSGDWDSYYADKRSSSTRKKDRNKRKRLAEFGEICFVTPTTEKETIETVDTMMAQKTRSLTRMGASDVFGKPGYREFFRDLASDSAARNLIHVSRLQVGNTIAAANFGLMFQNCYYHLITSHDDGELSRFGPGVVHLHELMRYAIERQCNTFDFTIGDEHYKTEWCENVIWLYDHTVPASWRGVPVAAMIAAESRIKRWIKRTPALWNAASRARAILGRLRR